MWSWVNLIALKLGFIKCVKDLLASSIVWFAQKSLNSSDTRSNINALLNSVPNSGVCVKRQQCLLATHNSLVLWQQNIIGKKATSTSYVLRQHKIIMKATGLC